MTREILFRGKRLSDGEWVEGGIYRGNFTWIIVTDASGRFKQYMVDPSTVGQYTGLTDKNGKRIWEGDIVRGRHWTRRNDKNPEAYNLWRVDWIEKSGLITFIDSPTTEARLSIHDFADFGEVEVIGNIHDNPELLKEADA